MSELSLVVYVHMSKQVVILILRMLKLVSLASIHLKASMP